MTIFAAEGVKKRLFSGVRSVVFVVERMAEKRAGDIALRWGAMAGSSARVSVALIPYAVSAALGSECASFACRTSPGAYRVRPEAGAACGGRLGGPRTGRKPRILETWAFQCMCGAPPAREGVLRRSRGAMARIGQRCNAIYERGGYSIVQQMLSRHAVVQTEGRCN